MKIRPVALFPGLLSQQKRAGLRFRGHGRRGRTQVSCRVDHRPHGDFAVPTFVPSDDVDAPSFRLQLEVARIIFTNPRRTAVVLQPAAAQRPLDPEQRLLRPMWHDDVRMTFEFVSGDVLSVCSDGTKLLRHAVIDPRTGQLGTEDIEITDVFRSLIRRCYDELSSRAPLFDAGKRHRPVIPPGIADLQLTNTRRVNTLVVVSIDADERDE
jgi:hypothetical protein